MTISKRLIAVSVLAAFVPALLLAGCSKPSGANINLRKQNQELRRQVESLQRQHDADAAALRGQSSTAATAPAISHDQARQLFTVHGIKLGRLTGSADLDPNKPGDEGLKVYVVPLDDQGEKLKAAGSFVVDAFDLAKQGEQRIGHWEFPVDDARKNWFGSALLYEYVLPAAWQTPPEHPEVTLKVTFTDALTGRSFTQQKAIRMNH
jgi:outer membrane murein-binding lipoprotein Lpp